MKLWLDFGDGGGPVDYTAALVAAVPTKHSNDDLSIESFAIERRRGAYARCVGTLNAGALGLENPDADCRVQVTSDAGAVLFAGCMSGTPQRVGPRVGAGSAPVRFVAVEEAFLKNAVVDTSLQPAGMSTHAVRFEDGPIHLRESGVVDRADDVTVTGAEEAVTYVTELFQGDGTTANFVLTDKPFALGGSQTLLADSFAGARFRSEVWRFADTGQHIGLGSGGLRLAGGNGFDGQTYMAAQTAVELGGTLCAEMTGVLLQAGSDGVLLGMYGNAVARANCFAGVRVDATGGSQKLVALVNGAAAGAAFSWSVGHSYTLRVRLHCAEMQRVRNRYQVLVNGVVQSFGGGVVEAPMQIVVEVIDEGLASSTPATVLYSGAVSRSPAQAVFAPVNSVSLVGSVQRCSLKRQGSLWVTSTLPDGTVVARRPGTVDTGEDYALHGSTVAFFPGRVPAAGESVVVRYRRSQRAEARLQDAEAVSDAQQQGLPGVRQNVCHVTGPEPASSADCAAAAQALLAWYGSPSLGVSGGCVLSDAAGQVNVQPGDVMALPLSAAAVNVPVERVTITSEHALPEVLRHTVAFAQTAANSLSFAVSESVPADAELSADIYVASTTESLPQLSVTLISGGSLQVDAGVDAPVGGGFEVRRHDGGWGPDVTGAPPDAELVLRSPVRSFSVPRVAFAERFYVRMYDGSETPVYSGQSSVVITHLPV